MTLDIFQVDAFTVGPFSGNPAAVIPLTSWLSDDLMQSIALENNLSETAFIIPGDGEYHIRWFTPAYEVDLCGHATLASAKVIFDEIGHPTDQVTFHSRSGLLYVKQQASKFILDFPTDNLQPYSDKELKVAQAIGTTIIDIIKGKDDLLCILESEAQVRSVRPDFAKIAALDMRGVIISAKANQQSNYDIVSRCFFPFYGINEDPVTGSAHTTIIPYWSAQLQRTTFKACQASYRGGLLDCELQDDRINIGGETIMFMKGKIFL